MYMYARMLIYICVYLRAFESLRAYPPIHQSAPPTPPHHPTPGVWSSAAPVPAGKTQGGNTLVTHPDAAAAAVVAATFGDGTVLGAGEGTRGHARGGCGGYG